MVRFLRQLPTWQLSALGALGSIAVVLLVILVVAVASDGGGGDGRSAAGVGAIATTTTAATMSTAPSTSTTTTSTIAATSTTAARPPTTARTATSAPSATAAPETAPPLPPPPEPAPGPSGTVRTVGAGFAYPTLQAALDAAQPGDVVQLAAAGEHRGPAKSRRAGSAGAPIVLTAVAGAQLACSEGRCLELNHSWYRLDGFAISGGSSNLYLVGAVGSYVHDVQIVNSRFRGRSGTGECIRVKYQANSIEIGHNDIADCGLTKCCDDSKNGEAVYIGTAPEQTDDNPSPEPDRTHGVWVHDNTMRPKNECVDIKESAYGNVVERNACSGQSDPESGAFGSRGGRVGEGNVFRSNVIENAVGACVRFGGDDDPDGTGNEFYGNTCRNIAGYGVKAMRLPQGRVCGNAFEGAPPAMGLSNEPSIDPVTPC